MNVQVLRLDLIACKGHGVCAKLLPELITLDEWGFPVIDATPITEELLGHARRAVTNCPAIALKLTRLAELPTPREI